MAVIRLRSLGDCVLTTPALALLKQFRPDLQLAVVVEDRFRAIFENNPAVDAILPAHVAALRSFQPQLCLNFHGGNQSAWLTAASGARFRGGFGHFRHQLLYNVRIPRAQQILQVERTVHTAEHLASAVFYLGAPQCEIPRATLVPPRPASAPPTPIAVIHPFASTPAKTWPADRFAAVAEHLCQTGLEPVVIGGPADDLSAFAAFRTLSGAPLSEIKQLLAGASLFVGNDSGPAHMAAAFGLPVVVIFAASDPAIWRPWRTASEVIVAPGEIGRVNTSQILDALARLRVPA